MVVSPGAGIFAPNEACVDGTVIKVGQLLGTVGSAEVRSSFAGEIKGVLAYDGERVTSRQPIAWLRTMA
jgi:[acyl-carrier-protein] S-malonyltransferase